MLDVVLERLLQYHKKKKERPFETKACTYRFGSSWAKAKKLCAEPSCGYEKRGVCHIPP